MPRKTLVTLVITIMCLAAFAVIVVQTDVSALPTPPPVGPPPGPGTSAPPPPTATPTATPTTVPTPPPAPTLPPIGPETSAPAPTNTPTPTPPASNVQTYQSDYSTIQTAFVQGDTVFIKWDVRASGLSSVDVLIFKGSNYCKVFSGVTPNSQVSWPTDAATPMGTYTVYVFDHNGGAPLCECTFAVISSLPLSESTIGSLAAILACFAAIVPIGLSQIKKRKNESAQA
ncbi:MAG: hypothetical protein NWE92_11265 [Candidatus Bathyarchaeota archaeon]|nr:hypothetical protein [Candidatus Bathyarchaeota archaeon]